MSRNRPLHSHALRKGRFSEPGRPYLLTTATASRQPLFADLGIARIVIRGMRYLHENQRVDSLAFVVMPDHIHWLFCLGTGQSLNSVMHSLKSWSSREINKQSGRRSPVWQSGYHDRALRREESIRAVARYVVANPLRAGLVDDIRKYPHWDAAWL